VCSRIRTTGTSFAAAAKNLIPTKKPAATKSIAVTAAETTKSQDLEKLRTPLQKRKPFGKEIADGESSRRAALQSDGGVEGAVRYLLDPSSNSGREHMALTQHLIEHPVAGLRRRSLDNVNRELRRLTSSGHERGKGGGRDGGEESEFCEDGPGGVDLGGDQQQQQQQQAA